MSSAKEALVPMRDGTKLYTLTVAPGEGRYPVLFIRTPYDPEDFDRAATVENSDGMLGGVFALVYQHCRGTGRSEGDFLPFEYEREDGLDTLEWIRTQPFFGGDIYPIGSSYLSAAHLYYLDTCPSDVRAGVLEIMTPDKYGTTYLNGFLLGTLVAGWTTAYYRIKSHLPCGDPFAEFAAFPLRDYSLRLYGHREELFDRFIVSPDPEADHWAIPSRHAFRDCHIPLLITTSFYDITTESILSEWETISPADRERCALIVTPYDHGRKYVEGSSATPICFPDGGLREHFPNYDREFIAWTRGGPLPEGFAPGMTTWYTLFENRWHSAPSIPEGEGRLRLFLNADGLGLVAGERTEKSYTYDPRFPASFKGGDCHNFGGMERQDEPGLREDILTFISAPFEEEAVAEGHSEVRLRVRTDGEDTAFYVHLSIVCEDGATYGLRSCILSLRSQNPDYRPGEEAELLFTLAPHSYLIGKGRRLRLDVSSSDFPNFSLHSNRAGDQFSVTDPRPARNTLICGASLLELRLRKPGA